MDSTSYDLVLQLQQTCAKLETLIVSADQPWTDHGYVCVEAMISGQAFTIPVDDEYDDPITANKAMQWHMILRTVADYEDSNDFLTWCNELGMDSTSLEVLAMYRHLNDIVPGLRRVAGEVQPLSHFDQQMNTGAMQSLRNRVGY
ncbi:MAG: hypothetical protein H6548_09380 [Chitinophagales bacterium]|nr:hypothetical protein [Chitinophagales bacterium]HAE13234.1 hypothetical protein [Bacteroidota bacterium]HAE35338.1 hypothetical protein [Bacteroidota bacterium]HPE97991.1 hypothetical protein [Chitinophagales bacterium]HPR28842.1 hypothetical protein [Chitinophagales bacterium]